MAPTWQVQSNNSGGSDIFAALGDILDGAKSAANDVFDVIGAIDERKLERKRLELAANMQGTTTWGDPRPITDYGANGGGGFLSGFDYQKASFVVAAIAASIVVLSFVLDRRKKR